MFGVSRVYSQQVSYILVDAAKIRDSLRGLNRIVKGNNIDLGPGKKGKGKAINLLEDDPAFDPDMPLPALDFDWDILPAEKGDSQGTLLSPGGSLSSSSRHGSLLAFNLPPSSSGHHSLPGPLAGSSAHKSGFGHGEGEEELLFEDDDDLGFEIDAEGNMRDVSVAEMAARRIGKDRSSGAAERVRKEHEEGRDAMELGDRWEMQINEDDGVMILDDENALPFEQPQLNQQFNPAERAEEDFQSTSSSTASAQQVRRKPKTKAKKHFEHDSLIMIKNSDILAMQQNYVQNQRVLSKQKRTRQGAALSKKNAYAFVWGNGINNVGQGIGSYAFTPLNAPSPLEMFSGEALLSRVLGGLQPSSVPAKRTSPSGNETPNKRARLDESPGIGRAPRDDEDVNMVQNDIMEDMEEEPEMGRDAQAALPDLPSSAMMPWNASASARPGSSSIHLGGRQSSLNPRRMTSASPLLGRGLNSLADLERLDSQHEVEASHSDEELMAQYGRSDSASPEFGGGQAAMRSDTQEFELFGQAAQVDTQTAETSQWIRNALATETENFFVYLSTTFHEREEEAVAYPGGNVGGTGKGKGIDTGEKWMGFEQLFNPEENSKMVAAQAFYHLLCLSTQKGRVGVHQAVSENVEIGEDIWVRML